MSTTLSATQLAHDLAVRDLTDPAEGPHGIQQIVSLAVAALVDAWGCEVRVARGPRVVPLADNYDDLLYPAEAITRDSRYTRHVDDAHVLRSHTSAMIPPALRELARGEPEGESDVLLVCPGITYRRDSIDRLHTGTPHQLDLWRITTRPVDSGDLDEMLHAIAATLLPGRTWRWEPRVHPYTLRGREVDVRRDDEWVEVWECGLAHPEVLARAGLEGRTGLALGMGLDRLLMLRKEIPDIRLLRSADPRVAQQMLDLSPYRPVSELPAVQRDLSIAVDRNDDVELLGDRTRHALGDDADVVESVEILSETRYDDLPEPARERLAMTRDHKNVLVRVILRPHDRTLTDTDANTLRDRIYAAIHQGARAPSSARASG